MVGQAWKGSHKAFLSPSGQPGEILCGGEKNFQKYGRGQRNESRGKGGERGAHVEAPWPCDASDFSHKAPPTPDPRPIILMGLTGAGGGNN